MENKGGYQRMKILNLGCGTKASSSPNVVNVDWNVYVRFKRNPLLRPLAPLVFRGRRLELFRSLPANIRAHNLAKGLPFGDDSVDAVYHSHMLEHLDAEIAPKFLLEILRVLKPKGRLRVVVPDFEEAARTYLAHVVACERDAREMENHNPYIGGMIEQSVRRESSITRSQPPLRRFLENAVLGDARRRGETHQWMYDRFNLSALLIKLGYRSPEVWQYNTSGITSWNEFGLDQNEAGGEYHSGGILLNIPRLTLARSPKSLYLEAEK
jgi:SAM-dependent methyltransferase